MVAVLGGVPVAALVSTRAGVARIAALARAVDAEQDPGAEAELALAEGQRSRRREVLVIEVEHRLPELDPPLDPSRPGKLIVGIWLSWTVGVGTKAGEP